MARPDEQVLMTIDGYQFKKARSQNQVFITSPQGVNITLDVHVLKDFLNKLENDETTAKQFGL
ncbi:hypothetical protein EPH95_01995 [Salicibibacter halophilus]|uniref:Uncharacterized protein n=1 Tax=Salicibibacter halophilus TaxID=2502791 RepID=A0A514LE09_9BACI|nr:hypothetical protein [Salicibibacter halophilus]QDI90093.1 hypothetical protein EPH95_01995 [Salicibibacter halophilus]